MPTGKTAIARARKFAEENGVQIPVLMAPMAGACPASLAIAVANAGGMGACGVLMMNAETIRGWVDEIRAGSNGAFQLNTWIPDPDPLRDIDHETAVRSFLAAWGPNVPAEAAGSPPPDFHSQCEAMLAAGPKVISSIMGLYPPAFVERMKEKNISWYANVTTVAEAQKAEAAGADALIAQGMEAGGHRGAFEASEADTAMVGLFSLLPAVVDAVDIPVIATGGIADGRGVAAALLLGASGVQIGTSLLRSPEAKIPPAWADAIGAATPEETIATRAFSGRLGRSLRTAYAAAASSTEAPAPAPYPIQRHLTQPMRTAAATSGSIDGMQAWAGQSAGLTRAAPAGDIVMELWQDAEDLLS